MARTRTSKPGELPAFTVDLDEDQRGKLAELQGFALANQVQASGGSVMRTLLMAAEPSLEFLGMLRTQVDKEKEAWRAKRSTVTRRKK